jgi:hypothetical protein
MIEEQPNGQPGSAIPARAKIEVSPSSVEAIAEEIATYRARLSEMVEGHDGEFVLIKGNEIVGFFPDESSAFREGRRRFGIVPMLVKRITATERVIYIPNVVL